MWGGPGIDREMVGILSISRRARSSRITRLNMLHMGAFHDPRRLEDFKGFVLSPVREAN